MILAGEQYSTTLFTTEYVSTMTANGFFEYVTEDKPTHKNMKKK